MTTQRLSGSDLWRRARIKTVVSRRFTSSSCSSHDEELGFEGDDEVYLSCFEDVSSNEFDDKIEEEEEEDANESFKTGQANLSRLSSVLSNGKKSDSEANENQNGVGNYFQPSFSRGPFYKTGEEDRFLDSQTQDKDFVDMAISRDGGQETRRDAPDMGLGRADPNYSSRERQKIKQLDKIPRSKKFNARIKFMWYDICIGMAAVIIFFIDIVTDIELAIHYFREEMWMYGGVTTGLIVVPSLITCFLGFHWYIIDYKKEKELVARLKKAKKKVHVTPDYVWFIRFTFTLLQIGPVVRIIEYLRCGHKSRCTKLTENQRRRFYLFMLYEDVDSCLLRLFESFLESAPQLTWQLYIAIVLKPTDNDLGTSIRCAALLSSWGSLAISLVSYHKSLRNSHEEKDKMSLKSLPIYFIWRASEVGVRVLCIAMFASTFKLWVFGPILFHWVVMSLWLMVQKTTFYKNKCLERFFNVICGYVMVFCFLNLREGVTRFRFLLFYFITYTENFFMLAFWFRFSPDLGAWFHLWGFVVVLALFLIHVIFQLMYYALFHPTGRIKLCLPCDPYIIYSSVCYDIVPSGGNEDLSDDVPQGVILVDENGKEHRQGDHRKTNVKSVQRNNHRQKNDHYYNTRDTSV